MIQNGRDLAARGIGISSDAELPQRGAEVKIRSLADHAFIFKHENDDQRKVDSAAGRRKPSPIAFVGSGESSLYDHCIFSVMHALGEETEVGESLLVLV